MFCQNGLYYEVYYRHLAYLSDRLGSLEVAISLIRKINYRSGSGPNYFGHSFDLLQLLFQAPEKKSQSTLPRNFTTFLGKVSSMKSNDKNVII